MATNVGRWMKSISLNNQNPYLIVILKKLKIYGILETLIFLVYFTNLKDVPGLKEYMAKKIKSFWNDKNIEHFLCSSFKFRSFFIH